MVDGEEFPDLMVACHRRIKIPGGSRAKDRPEWATIHDYGAGQACQVRVMVRQPI